MTSGHAAAGRQVRSETGLPLPVPAADPHHRHLQVTRHVPRGQECNTVTRGRECHTVHVATSVTRGQGVTRVPCPGGTPPLRRPPPLCLPWTRGRSW